MYLKFKSHIKNGLKKWLVLLSLFSNVNLVANGCEKLLEAFNKKSNIEVDIKSLDSIKQCALSKDKLDYWLRAIRIEAKYKLKNNAESVKLIGQALKNGLWKTPESSQELLAVAQTYISLGFRQNRLSQYEDAKNSYKTSDSLFYLYNIPPEKYNRGYFCLRPLADIYTRLGDYEKAIQTFKKAEQQLVLYKAKPDNFASLYNNWGNVYYDLEKHDELINIYKKGVNIVGLSNLYKAKMNYSLIQAELYKYLSVKNQAQQDVQLISFFDAYATDITLKNLTKVFQERITINPSDGYNFLNGIYGLRAEIGQEFKILPKDEIIELHKKSLQVVKLQKSENPNAREIAKQHNALGQTYLDFSETDSAKHYFYLGLQTILPKFNPNQNPLPNKNLFFNENAIFENLEGLAEVFTLQDSLELALQAYELAFYVKLKLRSIYDFESSKLYLQQKAKEVNAKAINTAFRLYQETNDTNVVERAFKIAESSRALVLLENIAKNQLLKQNEIADSLFAKQKAKFDKPISITDLQAHLTKNETIIQYFQADSQLYTFKVEQNKLPKFLKLTPNLNRLDQFLETLRTPNNAEQAIIPFKQLSHQLYKDIVAPLQILTGKKIIIIPDGQFNFLPFEVLLSHESNENSFKKLPYLLNDHIINYQYSATIFTKLRQQTNQAQLNKVLNIAPVFERTAHSLNKSKDEVKEIAQIFPADFLMRELATKANILKKINQYNVLHFSTHASGVDQVNKQQAHIVLHQDTLFLNEIYQQYIQANLVVLSACETNLGKYEGGEGVMSLSRAFAYAGCPGLVSTLWQVNDKSTKDIIVQFYSNIKQGKTKDEALQQAKLAYLKKADDTHPFYWSSLVAIGNMQPLVKNLQIPWHNYIWLLFPFTIAGYYWYKNTKKKNV